LQFQQAVGVDTIITHGWQARLALEFTRVGGRSVLATRRHSGPLRVQRPFYPEGAEVAHVYILHPPGGVVGGDELQVEVRLDTGAQALITTPASGKFYRSAAATAQITQTFQVASGAVLEWLPQDNIFYSGSRAQIKTRVMLERDSGFIGWELTSLGRPAAGECFSEGSLTQYVEIWRAGMPLFLERSHYVGGATIINSPWGLRGKSVVGTMLCVTDQPGLVVQLRNYFAGMSIADAFAVTQLDGVLVCRYLGDDAEQARLCFTRAWENLRPLILYRSACLPRIWST